MFLSDIFSVERIIVNPDRALLILPRLYDQGQTIEFRSCFQPLLSNTGRLGRVNTFDYAGVYISCP